MTADGLDIACRLDCECDQKFYNCLKVLGSDPTANGVGSLYFNKLVKTCFHNGDGSGRPKIRQTKKWSLSSNSTWDLATDIMG